MLKLECKCFGVESLCLEINNGVSKSWYHQYRNTLKYRIPHFYCILVIWLISSFYTTMTCFFFIEDINCFPRKSDAIKAFVIFMISRIWLYLQLVIKVATQFCWMLYLYLNLDVLPRHLIVNVFWANFIILLELQPKSICLCPNLEKVSIEVTRISMMMLSGASKPFHVAKIFDDVTTHRGLQAPCWMM